MIIKDKILKAMDGFIQVLKEKTLQTLEEVDASNGEECWAGAGAVAELNNNLKSMFKTVTGICTTGFTLGSLDHCQIDFKYTIPSGYKAIEVIGFNGVSWGASFAILNIGLAVVTNASRGTITVPANTVTETILCVKNDFI